MLKCINYSAVTGLFVLFTAGTSIAVEPIPGSITYDGRSQSILTTTPIGSVYLHQFDHRGNKYREVYKVGADRRLELVSRSQQSDS